MGNIFSGQQRRSRSSSPGTQANNQIHSQDTSGLSNLASTEDGENTVQRSHLRQTFSTLRRRLSSQNRRNTDNVAVAPRTPDAEQSASPQLSLRTSRRRAMSFTDREQPERNRQRARIEDRPEEDRELSNSFYFTFSMDADRNASTETPSPAPEPAQSPGTRVHAASEFFRLLSNRVRSEQEGSERTTPEPNSSNMVLVRVRQLSGENNQAERAADSIVEDILQWTVYFLIPPTAAANGEIGLPANFDHVAALEQAFAIMRSIMSGEAFGNSYEELTRLQETLGFVNRGVTADEINSQLTETKFILEKAPSLAVGNSCTICLLDYADSEMLRILPCEHSYHTLCIDTWLSHCNRCPLCREQPVKTNR